MVRHGSVLVVVSWLAAMSLSTPSHADNFFDDVFAGFGPPAYSQPERSAYLNWMIHDQLAGRAAPIAIANRPCYVYDGSRLVVLQCPGAVVSSERAYSGGPWVSARY